MSIPFHSAEISATAAALKVAMEATSIDHELTLCFVTVFSISEYGFCVRCKNLFWFPTLILQFYWCVRLMVTWWWGIKQKRCHSWSCSRVLIIFFARSRHCNQCEKAARNQFYCIIFYRFNTIIAHKKIKCRNKNANLTNKKEGKTRY